MFDAVFAEIAEKDTNGTLTVGEALIGGYYRIREGEHAGRVIIKSGDKIDGQEIIRFANGLTWVWIEKIKGVKCERTSPTFPAPRHEMDYSQATWYNDGGGGPQHHEW